MSLQSAAQLCYLRKFKETKIKLSLAFLSIPDVSPIDAIKIAADAKFDALSLRLLPATNKESKYPLLLDDKLAKQVKKNLKNYGLFLSDIKIIRIKPNFKLNDFKSIISRTCDLGCKNIITVGDDRDRTRLIENFTYLCESAERYDLTISLEALPWSSIPSIHDAFDVITKSKAENAKLILDALHFYRNEKNQGILRKIPANLFSVFQICDGTKTYKNDTKLIRDYARTQRLPPGEGELDLRKLIGYINKKTIISIEVPNQKMLHSMKALDRAKYLMQCTKKIVNIQ